MFMFNPGNPGLSKYFLKCPVQLIDKNKIELFAVKMLAEKTYIE
jgi:hypothetical protein